MVSFNISEILILYELENISFSKRYEELIHEIIEKGSRLLGIRRLAIMLDEGGKRSCLGRWGFRKDNEVAEKIKAPGGNCFVYSMSHGVDGIILFETSREISCKEKRLLNIFARRIEETIALKQAEKRLKESEEEKRIIYNNVHDAIFIHDPKGKILDVNRTMLRMYGIASKKEAVMLSITEDYSASGNSLEKLYGWWKKALEGESPRFEWKARRPADGGVFDAEV